MNNLGLGFVFSAKDLASGAFEKIRKSFEKMDASTGAGTARMEDNFKALKVGLGALAVGGALVGGAFAIANPAGDFEAAVAKVGAVANAGAEDMIRLRDSAFEAALATTFSPVETAQGLEALASMGFDAAESAKALRPALDLATGGAISVESATVAMSAALKVFSIDVADAGATADKMLQISNATALSAKDLELAMGTIGRGASVAKQSIDEMLPSIGLVKNTGVDVSVASSSVSAALLEMAKNADAFKKIGVSVQDADGGFRPFLDVIQDTDKALAGMTDVDRVTKATDLFGRFGLTAYSAITTQIQAGVKDASGKLVKGAEAVAFLRGEMERAGGASERFKERLLDTFQGQKDLLANKLRGLAVVLGEPFLAVLKPIVSGLDSLFLGLIRVIGSIPKPVKTFLAGLLVATGVLIGTVGAILLAKAAFGILSIAVKAAAGAFMAAAAPMLAFLPLLGIIGGAIGIFYLTARKDGEGFSDFMGRMWGKVKLAVQGLAQVFRDGGFSGAVREELGKADNLGLKTFVIQIYQFVDRAQRAWDGFKTGFSRVYESTIRPIMAQVSTSFDGLRSSLSYLGKTFSKTFGTASSSIDLMIPAGERFNASGESMGETLARVVAGVAVLVDWFVKLLDIVVQVADAVVTVFDKVGTFIGEGAAQIYLGVTEPVESAKRSYYAARDLAQGTTVMTIEERNKAQAIQKEAEAIPTSPAAAAALSTAPAVAQVEAVSAASQPSAPAISSEEIASKVGAAVSKAIAEQNSRPVVLQVDGETLARSSQRAAVGAAARSFTPIPMAAP